MNEGEVSDLEAHERTVVKRCKLMFVPTKGSGDAAYKSLGDARRHRPCRAVGPVIKDSKRQATKPQPRNNAFPRSRPNALFVVPCYQHVRPSVGFLSCLLQSSTYHRPASARSRSADEGCCVGRSHDSGFHVVHRQFFRISKAPSLIRSWKRVA